MKRPCSRCKYAAVCLSQGFCAVLDRQIFEHLGEEVTGANLIVYRVLYMKLAAAELPKDCPETW